MAVQRFFNCILYLIMMTGFPLLIWVSYSFISEAHEFAAHGIEKQAYVSRLEQKSHNKGGYTYSYQLEIDSVRLTAKFPMLLPEQQYIAVLTLPNEPNNIIIGAKDSSLLDIFISQVGGEITALLFIGFFCLFIVVGPFAFVFLVKNAGKFINQK